MRLMLLCSLTLPGGMAHAADVITCDFAAAPDQPWLQLVGDASVAGGVLRTAPLDNWQRSGLYVGPLPVGATPWHIEYDVGPVAYGSQCQEFVSVTPSTHWYMAYCRPDGRINLHTRYETEWKARGGSTAALELGKWYHVSVDLGATSVRLRVREQDATQDLWDSGETPLDHLGQETVFGLIDEAPDTAGATEWDNLVVSTDDPQVAERMAQRMKELEDEREAAERRAEAARRLREAGVALIPLPQQVELLAGERGCRLVQGVKVSGGDDEARAAVASVLKERLGLDAVPARDGGTIRLKALPPDGPPELQSEQAYTLSVADGRVEIAARAPVGVFYAAQTLCQLADEQGRCPAVRIADWPAIDNRLVMIAVCQGAFQVIDVEYWKRIIRELAAVKVTHIQVYFEGATFYFEKYPFLGLKGRDGFTIEKGKLLSDYAKAHFVELLPQQNSLGHAGTILSHEELANLRESGDVFCSSKPETFAFLGDLYDELIQGFPHSTWIHVGGDEFAQGFAQCDLCKKRAAEIGPEGLYAEHMMKLHEMLAQRNRKMMIWWHEQGYTEKAADRLSKDIAVFDWHYGNQASYPSLERLQSLGFTQTWATPAITRYYDGSNDWDNTFGNVSGFLKAGAQRKVPGECTYTWVHGIWGGRNLFELNLYGLLFSADCSWSPLPADYADFRWRFARQWFGLRDGDIEQQVRDAIHYPYGPPKDQGFWSSNRTPEEMLAAPLAETAEDIGARPEIVAEAETLLNCCVRARTVLDAWEQAATRNQVTVKYLKHDVLIHETLARRILSTAKLLNAYERTRGVPADQRDAALAEPLGELEQVAAAYLALEQGFHDSVLEAGGGECGWGGWYEFVAKGGVMFRAQEGRAEVEKAIAHVRDVVQQETLPATPFASGD